MIRYNANGEYNVPFGRYQNFNTHLITPEHSALLQQATIFSCDYSKTFAMASEHDFMFLDPHTTAFLVIMVILFQLATLMKANTVALLLILKIFPVKL